MTDEKKAAVYSDSKTLATLNDYANKLGISIKATLALIIRNTDYNDCLEYIDAERKNK